MSEGSESQSRSEEQVNLSEGTSPSNSNYEEGSRSTQSNLPKATTRQRKKKTLDSEDEDFEVEEVTSKKKVLKEYGAAAATKPGMRRKLLQREFPCPNPEPPLGKLWSSLLNQERKRLLEERRGRRESRRLWPELLANLP